MIVKVPFSTFHGQKKGEIFLQILLITAEELLGYADYLRHTLRCTHNFYINVTVGFYELYVPFAGYL